MSGQPGLDVSIFDTIVETGDAQTRVQLAVELARLINDPQAPENERSCVVPTVLKLTTDPVKEVRRALADGLVGVQDLDGDILFSIIADDDDIALPFLAATPALDPWKMRSIVRVGDAVPPDHAGAARGTSLTTSSKKSSPKPISQPAWRSSTMKTALIGERNCRILYARFGRVQEIIDRLLALDDLPLDVRILQAKRASNQVHQLVAERGWVPANDAADMVADAEERAILKILDSANDRELPPLIRFMTSRSMFTASIVMRAACTGQMHLVKIAMAHLPACRWREWRRRCAAEGLASTHSIAAPDCPRPASGCSARRDGSSASCARQDVRSMRKTSRAA